MTAQIVPPLSAVSILVIAAHPDDMEGWCGASIAMATTRDATVELLLVTSGDKGSGNSFDDPIQVAMRREWEARIGASRLGIEQVSFLRYPDSEVENTPELRCDLVTAIRRVRPDIVFTFDPEHPLPRYLAHRDHRATGRAALDAIYPLACDPLVFPEHRDDGLEPHKVRQVWLFASAVANRYIDISEGFDAKIHARLAHKSQTDDPAALPDTWRCRAGETGEPVGLAMAEAFTILDIG